MYTIISTLVLRWYLIEITKDKPKTFKQIDKDIIRSNCLYTKFSLFILITFLLILSLRKSIWWIWKEIKMRIIKIKATNFHTEVYSIWLRYMQWIEGAQIKWTKWKLVALYFWRFKPRVRLTTTNKKKERLKVVSTATTL